MSKAYLITAGAGIDSLTMVERDVPSPAPGQVKVRVRAVSLNHRDLGMARGTVPDARTVGFVPASDGAGEVTAVGQGVSQWKVGDRVTCACSPDWYDGPPDSAYARTAIGGANDGVLAEEVLLPAHGLVRIPDSMTFVEAASFPCAGVTAYNALFGERPVQPGQTVLVQGTGGVSIFALQLARAAGAFVIATSSSDDKLARCRELGANALVNYRTSDWVAAAKEITGGRGVDTIVEVTGRLAPSIDALAPNGTVSIIGATLGLDEPSTPVNPRAIFSKAAVLRGIFIGSVVMFRKLLATYETNGLRPIVDSVHPFADARGAYEAMHAANHFGKLVIGVD
ncbi:MAG: NAD(P)-dependent alcohol dehydrogenase [Acidimicrobiia bacterium]